MNKFILLFVQSYISIIYYFRRYLGIRIHGMGYVQHFLRFDFDIPYAGDVKKLLHYDHRVVGSYDYLLIGRSNEPETPLFFNMVVSHLPKCNFIEVGASIGEFVVEMSCYKNVVHIYAFEPRKECVNALRETIRLNEDEERIDIFPFIAADKQGKMTLYNNPGGTSSGIYGEDGNTYTVDAVTIDGILPPVVENAIMLVDVEGAEPFVLRGGKKFIETNKPLIIFEYNDTSKKHFNLDDIYRVIGANYVIYRIKGDASLDKDFTNSWNCVAIPKDSLFEKIFSL